MRHLGNKSSGSSYYDPSLLETQYRSINRINQSIDPSSFMGWDIWNCYEFSTLDCKSLPVQGILRIAYSSGSEKIVESKSLKLYLNSFNMTKMVTDRNEPNIFARLIVEKIKNDLSKVIGDEVIVTFSDIKERFKPLQSPSWSVNFQNIDSRTILDTSDLCFTENPSLLKINPDPHSPVYIRVRSSSLRSNCKVTNQPDFGDIYINLEGENIPDLDGLYKYLISFRNESHFHEEVCEMIYQRLFSTFAPTKLMVACFYTRRGGIDINPIRANHPFSIPEQILIFDSLPFRTLRN